MENETKQNNQATQGETKKTNFQTGCSQNMCAILKTRHK